MICEDSASELRTLGTKLVTSVDEFDRSEAMFTTSRKELVFSWLNPLKI